jgi:hypothetical protein
MGVAAIGSRIDPVPVFIGVFIFVSDGLKNTRDTTF